MIIHVIPPDCFILGQTQPGLQTRRWDLRTRPFLQCKPTKPETEAVTAEGVPVATRRFGSKDSGDGCGPAVLEGWPGCPRAVVLQDRPGAADRPRVQSTNYQHTRNPPEHSLEPGTPGNTSITSLTSPLDRRNPGALSTVPLPEAMKTGPSAQFGWSLECPKPGPEPPAERGHRSSCSSAPTLVLCSLLWCLPLSLLAINTILYFRDGKRWHHIHWGNVLQGRKKTPVLHSISLIKCFSFPFLPCYFVHVCAHVFCQE